MTWWPFAIVALLALVLTLQRVGSRRHKRETVDNRYKALGQIRLLRLLLEQVQRHRGLCFGVMSGETTLDSQRWSVHLQVNHQFESLAQHEGSLFWYASWHPVRALWQQITPQIEIGSAESVLQLHHRLADRLLETIQALGERHDLICLGTLAPQPQGMWLELLKNTEVIGRARAIGTGIAARRQNTALQRQELQRLRDQIMAQCYQPPARLCTEPLLRHLLAQPVRHAEDCLDTLTGAMEHLLTTDGDTRMASNTYFHIATQAISAQLTLVDLLLERLALPGGLKHR